MTLEESLKALKSAFTSKSADAEAMAKEMSALQAKNETLAAEFLAAEFASVSEKLEASAALAALAVERDAAIAKIEELTKALAVSESLKAEAGKQIESVGKAAAKIVASVGIQPIEISAADSQSAKSPEEIWNEYCAMKDPAQKVAFYNKNRAAIVSHLGVK